MTLSSDLQSSLGTAYTLERELGGAGMSRVFVAEEVALGRTVAVKVLMPELAAGVSAERFQREIKLAAQLQHPNIVPVLATGIAAGLPYYTMPFIDGLSLRARLDRNPGMPIAEAIPILKDMARALAYAHDHGVVHRDIKPENVLLADEAAVVTDFGIAKALSVSRTAAPGGTLTQVGTSLGTPAYMSPEQAAGDPDTDHRADIYAFGCVAYELLTGAPPFAYKQPHQLFAAHMKETPVPVQVKRPDCPPELAALIMKCLEKEPDNRPQSARDLLRWLDTGTGQTAAQPRTKVRWTNKREIIVSAIVAAAVAIAAAAAAYVKRDAVDIRSLAVLPFVNVGGDTANAYFAEGMADELTTELSKGPGLTLASRSAAFRFHGQNVDVRSVGRELGVGAVLEGTVRRAGDRLRLTAQLSNATTGKLLWTDSYEQKVQDVFAVQDSVTRAIVDALKVKLAGETARTIVAPGSASQGTKNLEAYDLYLRGRYLWARRGTESLKKAIDLFQQAIAKDPQFSRAHAGLAMALSVLPMYTPLRSDSIVPTGLAAGRRAIALDPNLSDAHLGYANMLIYQYKWPEAEEHFKRALALDPANATAHQWYGDYLYVIGRAGEAMPELRRATELDPLSAVINNDFGFALSVGGRYQEAIAAEERALELDSTFVYALDNMGIALLEWGKTDSAIVILEKRDLKQAIASEAPSLLIRAYMKANRREDAKRVLDSVRVILLATPEGADLLFGLAHASFGNADSAFYWLNRSVERHEGWIFVISLPCQPQLLGLRSDPRFDQLLKKLGASKCTIREPR
jgi:TolB-like protein/tetratricopeptide (TPR) repeat protein